MLLNYRYAMTDNPVTISRHLFLSDLSLPLAVVQSPSNPPTLVGTALSYLVNPTQMRRNLARRTVHYSLVFDLGYEPGTTLSIAGTASTSYCSCLLVLSRKSWHFRRRLWEAATTSDEIVSEEAVLLLRYFQEGDTSGNMRF
jgi:hypothetical protein